MAIKKYYVTVDDLGNSRWYKDAKCKVLHRENGPAVDCYGAVRCDPTCHRFCQLLISWVVLCTDAHEKSTQCGIQHNRHPRYTNGGRWYLIFTGKPRWGRHY